MKKDEDDESIKGIGGEAEGKIWVGRGDLLVTVFPSKELLLCSLLSKVSAAQN